MMDWFRKWRERMMVQPYMGTVEDGVSRALEDEAAVAKLARIRQLLFPEPSIETLSEGTKVAVDHSVDYNLDAALDDLVDGNNDEVPQRTVRRAVGVLTEVRRLLDAEAELPAGVRRIFFAGINWDDREEG